MEWSDFMLTAETFNWILYSWIAIAVVIFPVLLKITAPYGRHSKTNWGPMINNNLGWFLMELPAFAIFVGLVISGNGLSVNIITLFMGLWFIHYFHRAIIFPLRLRTRKKKMPVLIMVFAVFFNSVNGFINGYWFGYLSPGYEISWLYDPRFIVGGLLFVLGFFINQYHDKLLLDLRKKNPGEYKIPFGGLFRYISCPNFYGEIMEWAGFALMTWCLPTFSFFLWTLVNLLPRALDHHKWYKQKFEDYPKNRKAVFPYIL